MTTKLLITVVAVMLAVQMSFSTTTAQAQTNYCSLLSNTFSNYLALHTNAEATFVNVETNWSEIIPASQITNAVNDLAASGDICRVRGHAWRDGTGEERVSFLDCRPPATFRACKICGKCESKMEGDLK